MVNRPGFGSSAIDDTDITFDLTDDPWGVLFVFHIEGERMQWRILLERLSLVLSGEGPGPVGDLFITCVGQRLFVTLTGDHGLPCPRATMVLDRGLVLAALQPAILGCPAACAGFDWDAIIDRMLS